MLCCKEHCRTYGSICGGFGSRLPGGQGLCRRGSGHSFDDYFETFAAVTAEYAPDAIIVSSEKRMRSIAARIAAVCKTAVIADVNAMEVAEGKLYCSHLVYGGAAVRCESSAADTTVVVLAPGSFEDLKGEAAEKESVDFAAPAHPAKFVERREKQGETVNLSAAKRAVGIGRGLAQAGGSRDGVCLCRKARCGGRL